MESAQGPGWVEWAGGGRGGAGGGDLLDAEVVLLEEEAAGARTVAAALYFGKAAEVAGAEEIVLERAAPHPLDVLGCDQFPLLRLHAAAGEGAMRWDVRQGR
jgi:hypothetical protein